MADVGTNISERQLTVRHRDRLSQTGIFFRKFLRMFVYQSDWKMLPMAALIAGLVGFALGGTFGVNMEGTLMGSFAVVCVCIWNGSFNSIQVVCRERDVIKREHRSGMHITSYIMAHMMYQLILCVLQTIVTVVVLNQVGMKFKGEGLFTPWLVVDVGFTMLLITYAADLLSLWISTLVHTTTTAMTVMPFVLIFQLVFSGGLFALPEIVDPIVQLTFSSPGLKAMASQTNANSLPYSTVTDMLYLVDDVQFGGYITVGQVLDALGDTKNKTIVRIRNVKIEKSTTVREAFEELLDKDAYADLLGKPVIGTLTVGDTITSLLETEALDEFFSTEVGYSTTVGEIVDSLAKDPIIQEQRGEGLTITTTLGDIMDLVGKEKTKALVESKASQALYNPDYAHSKENIIKNWLHLLLFIVIFAFLSTFTLEFIDKDKR